MKTRCENEVCNQVALFTIAGINCCGNHTSWAARKGLEQSDGKEITIAWAAKEAA